MNQPWPSIVEQYQGYAGESESIRAVSDLCDHIASGPLSNALFAWTSMFDLHIVQTPVEYPYEGPRLLVSPRLDGQVEFRYVDTPAVDRQWVRSEKPEMVVARLHEFLRQLRWVTEDLL